jgi:cardiolipin synthase
VIRSIVAWPADYGSALLQLAMRRRMVQRLRREPKPIPEERPTLDPDALEAVLKRRSGKELKPGFFQLYTTGEQALTALTQMIDQATCRIDVLMYLWDNDPLGWEVAQRLAAVAGPNLPVRILVDGGGNLNQGLPKEANALEVNRVVCWLSHQPYVQLIRTRDPGLHFDHRKLVVVDGRVAWSGGRNFTYPSFFEDRDISYTVIGPLVCEMEQIYEKFWRKQGGCPGQPLACDFELPDVNAMARLVETNPHQLKFLARTLYRALDSAKHHIYMENPYVADNWVVSKLIRARRRGVDVRVVLTFSDESNTINTSNKVTANRLREAGIPVYVSPSMTHVKATAVDGLWAYMGTGNFDRLSLRHNHEMGMAIGSGPLIQQLEERVFLADFRPEWEVTDRIRVRINDYVKALVASLLY